MKRIKLRIVSDNGVEATIHTDGNHGGAEDYYAVVTIDGLIRHTKIHGIDPIQAFSLGLGLIEDVTRDKRAGDEEDAIVPAANWRIEVVDD